MALQALRIRRTVLRHPFNLKGKPPLSRRSLRSKRRRRNLDGLSIPRYVVGGPGIPDRGQLVIARNIRARRRRAKNKVARASRKANR